MRVRLRAITAKTREGGVMLHLACPSDPGTWYPLDGPWLASEPGPYSVRVSAGVVTRAVPYTITFQVEPGWCRSGSDPSLSRNSLPVICVPAAPDPAG